MWLIKQLPKGALLLAFATVLFITACTRKNPLENEASQTQVALKVTLANEQALPKSSGLLKTARIVSVVVRVTAPDISPIIRELQIIGNSATVSITVPQGNARLFIVQGLDEASIVQFEGQKSADLTTEAATVDITVAKIFPTPSGLRIVGDPRHDRLDLEWDLNSDQDFSRYELYRSLTTARPPLPLITFEERNAVSYSDTTVNPQTTFTYWLITVDTEGYQAPDNQLQKLEIATPHDPTPQPVTVTIDTVSTTEVKLSWTRSEAPDFALYRVVRAESDTALSFDAPVHFDFSDQDMTSFTDSSVEPCKAYHYAVYTLGRVSYGDFPSGVSNAEMADLGVDFLLGLYTETAPGERLLFDVDSFIGTYKGGGAIFDPPPIIDDNTEKQEGGISKKATMTVDVSRNQFAGWFIQWGTRFQGDSWTRDMSEFLGGKLTFWVKSSINLEIGIRSGNIQPPGSEQSKVILNSTNYPQFNPDDNWYQINIPLSDFTIREPRLDMTRIKILFNVASNVPSGGTGNEAKTFWIDDVRWEKKCEE